MNGLTILTVATMALTLVFTMGCDSKSTGGTGSGSGGSADGSESVEQLKAGIENNHPATHYKLALKLFEAGQKDDAVFWFYLGQLRYRFHLTTAKNLDPSGDGALFASLSEVVGRPINEYAFGDIPKLVKTIDAVLEWDEQHDNGFTPKKGNEAALESIRKGLGEMKVYLISNEESIKAQRKANGL